MIDIRFEAELHVDKMPNAIFGSVQLTVALSVNLLLDRNQQQRGALGHREARVGNGGQ